MLVSCVPCIAKYNFKKQKNNYIILCGTFFFTVITNHGYNEHFPVVPESSL